MKTTITTTSITPSSIPSPNPLKYSLERFHNHPSVVKFPQKASSIIVQCSKNGSPENGGSLKNILSGMVDERVEELLNKEENRDLLNGLEQASLRVEMAKRELAAIDKQELEAKIMKNYVTQLESRASEIAECQKEITEARMMLEEAERSLTYQSSNTLPETKSDEVINKNEEKVESIKAALIAAASGTLVELPISLTRATTNSQSMILPLAVTFISCALFGATFRYTIRKDLDNVHLKSGTSAAFGFVKGLGMLGNGEPPDLESSSIVQLHVFHGAVYVSESVLIFLFAGVALDFCVKLGILSTFPIDRSVITRT